MRSLLRRTILEGVNSKTNNLTEILKEEYVELRHYHDIYLYDKKEGVLIIKNDNVVLCLTLIDLINIQVSFLDPFDWKNGICKEIGCKIFNESKLLDFLDKKEDPMFLYKRNLLEAMENFGLDTDFDFINKKDKLTLSIEDIICIMKDSYMKGLQNIKK